MKKIKKTMLWYLMFNKRLLHKYSFILILVLIPLFVPIANIAMNAESSILKIAIVSNGNESAERIANSLKDKKSIIKYISYDSEDEAKKSLKLQKTDAVWVFGENFDKDLKEYVKNKEKKPVISVYEREDNVMQKLSRIQLFSSIFSDLSYEIFEDFIYNNIISSEEMPERFLEKYYSTDMADGDVVEIKKIHDTSDQYEDNFLTSPLRGILSVLIVFSGLAAAMMFLSDQSSGKYEWLTPKKRIIPAFGLILSAVSMTSFVVFIAFLLSGFVENLIIEIIAMILFVISSTLFSLLFAILFRSAGKLGALTPFLTLLMLVFSPIFFSLDSYMVINSLIPPYYYINAVSDSKYLLYMLVYIAGLSLVIFLLNSIINNKARDRSYIG